MSNSSSAELNPLNLQNLDLLDESHYQILERAVKNVLSTESAEVTYAQILDGLPRSQAIKESLQYVEDHPVYALSHNEICPGYLDKARKFRDEFDVSQLRFQGKTLLAFQDAAPGSGSFHLRLIELVVVAVHQIAAYLYELDDGAHPHEVHREWRERFLEEKKNGTGIDSRKWIVPPPTAFTHPAYGRAEQYPRGLADVTGYWAEAKIFGGVVVFDRGESEDECKAMWIHSDILEGPSTLYPPTQEQFESLLRFLLAEEDANPKPECPLPIHGTPANRPRWHPHHAFADYHIFRDRYERNVGPRPPVFGCAPLAKDWPELQDRSMILLEGDIDMDGSQMVTDEQVAKAKADIGNITPSSPLWGHPITRPQMYEE